MSKPLAQNRKASHDYFIEETLEVGIVLKGTEVKSIRQGKVQLKDSYAQENNGEMYVHNMHISPFKQGNIYNVDPTRKRKLLLHKREITKLAAYTAQMGYSLIPLKLYLSRGKVKILLGTAKGKRNYDKRQSLKEKDDKIRTQQALRDY